MAPVDNKKAFKSLLMRELVLDPRLAEEFKVWEVLDQQDHKNDAAGVLAALDKGALVEDLGVEKSLKTVLRRKQLSAFSRAMAERLESAEKDGAAYQGYCQVAVCDGVARAPARAVKSLKKAGDIEDQWARHHHLMGLVQGVRNKLDDARLHLQTALENEPFYHGKIRVQQALECFEEADGASA